MIHLYDVDRFLLIITFGSTNLFGVYYLSFTIFMFFYVRNFILIGSVEDHSAAVTSLKVDATGCKLLSCSVDGYVI